MPRSYYIENAAWKSLDDYCKRNPKPRLSPRMRHRCKIWIASCIQDYIMVGPDYENDLWVIDDVSAMRMIDYAHRTINE